MLITLNWLTDNKRELSYNDVKNNTQTSGCPWKFLFDFWRPFLWQMTLEATIWDLCNYNDKNWLVCLFPPVYCCAYTQHTEKSGLSHKVTIHAIWAEEVGHDITVIAWRMRPVYFPIESGFSKSWGLSLYLWLEIVIQY